MTIKKAKKKTRRKNLSQILWPAMPNLEVRNFLLRNLFNENMANLVDSDSIEEKFEISWDDEKRKGLEALCEKEGLQADKLQEVISNYLYT